MRRAVTALLLPTSGPELRSARTAAAGAPGMSGRALDGRLSSLRRCQPAPLAQIAARHFANPDPRAPGEGFESPRLGSEVD